MRCVWITFATMHNRLPFKILGSIFLFTSLGDAADAGIHLEQQVRSMF